MEPPNRIEWAPLVHTTSSPSEYRFCNWDSGRGEDPLVPIELTPPPGDALPSGRPNTGIELQRFVSSAGGRGYVRARERSRATILTRLAEKICLSSRVANWLVPTSISGSIACRAAAERICGILFVYKIPPKEGILVRDTVIHAPQIIIFLRGIIRDRGRLARIGSGVDVECRGRIERQHRIDRRRRLWVRRGRHAAQRNRDDIGASLD